MLLGLQLLQLRKIDCIGIWMKSIGQCMYLKKMVFCVDIIHFCYKEMENVNLIFLQYCQSIDIRAFGRQLLAHSFNIAKELGCKIVNIGIVEENRVLRKWYELNGAIHIGTKKYDFFPFTCGYMKKEL